MPRKTRTKKSKGGTEEACPECSEGAWETCEYDPNDNNNNLLIKGDPTICPSSRGAAELLQLEPVNPEQGVYPMCKKQEDNNTYKVCNTNKPAPLPTCSATNVACDPLLGKETTCLYDKQTRTRVGSRNKTGVIEGATAFQTTNDCLTSYTQEEWSKTGCAEEIDGKLAVRKCVPYRTQDTGRDTKIRDQYTENIGMGFDNATARAMATKSVDAQSEKGITTSQLFKGVTGGAKKKMTATKERAMVGKRQQVVYEGPRGGKYVRKDGEYVSLKKLAK